MTGVCEWDIIKDTTIGSDHYPIKISAGLIMDDNNIKTKRKMELKQTELNVDICIIITWQYRHDK